MFRHILIPTDGSELSARAIAMALDVARVHGARVTAITVSEPFRPLNAEPLVELNSEEDYRAECEKHATQVLDGATKAAAKAGMELNAWHMYSNQPYEAIIEAAETEGCDLICMASHGRKGLSALVLGSETVKVLTHVRIPVLVCR
jgi:nucleotide-binding universal stress UspA family protein